MKKLRLLIANTVSVVMISTMILTVNAAEESSKRKTFFEPKNRKEIPYQLLEIVIERGDTLHSFAKKYLDDPSKWPELLEYNKIPSGNPNLILPGDKVKVPIAMVKDEIADIFYMKNNVRMRRKGSGSWDEAKMYQRLFPEDGIRTEEKSFTKIKYLKGSIASIGENSMVFLVPEKKRADVIELRVGEITAKDVKVLTATAAIDPGKGSEYTAKVDRDKTTTLSVLKGKVDFISSGEIVTVLEGFMSVAELNQPPSEPMKMPDPPKFDKKELQDVRDTEDVKYKKIKDEGVLESDYFLEKLNLDETLQSASVGKESKQDRNTAQVIEKVHIQVAQDIEFSRIVLDKVISRSDFQRWQEQLEDGIYWWRGSFITNKGVESEYSDPVELAIDTSPIKLEILSPEDGTVSLKDTIIVEGKTERGISVKINSRPVVVYDDGGFEFSIKLRKGSNRINIKASDLNKQVAEKTINVTGKFDVKLKKKGPSESDSKFFLEIDAPKNNQKISKSVIVVRGRTNPGVEVVVNGIKIVVENDGTILTGVNLMPGYNFIDVAAVHPSGSQKKERIKVLCTLKGLNKGDKLDKSGKLDISTPKNGERSKKRVVLIKGSTRKDMIIKVNDARAAVDTDGSFVTAVYLLPGENKIVITATDPAGEVTTKELTVIGAFK